MYQAIHSIHPLAGLAGLCVMILLLYALPGCEESDLSDLPYVERLVVYSNLAADADTIRIQVMRTLPFSETYTPEAATVVDALCTVDAGGAVVTLFHQGLGIYAGAAGSVRSGTAYSVTVQWKGMAATATTVIPSPAIIEDVRLIPASSGPTGQSIEADVRATEGTAYGLRWFVRRQSGVDEEGGTFHSILRKEDGGTGGLLTLREPGPLNMTPGDTVFAVVYSFDIVFYDYFISKGGNQAGYDDRIFRELGGYVNWNVEGDGIGLVVGSAIARRRAEQ